jgi:hypothetical protein
MEATHEFKKVLVNERRISPFEKGQMLPEPEILCG